MFIYVIVCGETLKIYIGQHSGNNLRKYLQNKFADAKYRRGGRSRLYNAIRKYPQDSWSIHALAAGIETKTALDETEKHFIRALNTQHPDVGYNICGGGEGQLGNKCALGCKHSAESIRRAQLHYTDRELWKRRQSEAHKKYSPQQKGAVFTEEHKKSLSLAHKSIPWSAARRAAQEARNISGAQILTNRRISEAKKGSTPWNKGKRSES